MKILEKINNDKFPFEWANLDYLPESIAHRKEIYLLDDLDLNEGLLFLFYSLFDGLKKELIVFNHSWWDFCLDTWDINKDEHDYTLEGKSNETKAYLNLLIESEIGIGYSGSCNCRDWNVFLQIIIKCITSYQAPYSPLFCGVKNNFFFYFHHSGSIGIYYKEDNEVIEKILRKAYEDYEVK